MLESLNCRLCGGELQLKDDGTYVCSHCGRTFVKKAEDDYATSLKTLIDAEKLERVSAVRQNLWRAMHEEYINSSSCLEYARELKNLIPSDYYANFAEVSNGKNDSVVSRFLNESSGDDIGLYADAVLDFMLRSLTSGTLTAVSSYIDRAFDKSSPEYSKYIDLFETETNKVDAGIYELSITRDVFIAYSSADMPKVLELCDFLEEQDITCFLAMRNLRHGKGAADNYDRAIQTAMDNCRVVVFVSSKNSRKLGCDAMRKELPYMRKVDTDNAPAEYKKLSYDKLPARYKKDRVEYILDDYTGSVADTAVKQYFDGFEWCTSLEAVALRVVNYLSSVPDVETGERYGGIGEEDLQKIVSAVSGDKVSSVSIEEKEKNVIAHVARLVSIGNFSEATTSLSDLEKDEISAKGACPAVIYYYKLLADNEAKSDEELINKRVDSKKSLQDDTTYRLIKSCADSSEKSKVLEIQGSILSFIAENERKQKEIAEEKKRLEAERRGTPSSGLAFKKLVDEYVVTGMGTCKDTKIIIPSEYEGLPVTGIDEHAFKSCKEITGVDIPSSVTHIGDEVFYNSRLLSEVVLPDSINIIGTDAFGYCINLEKLTISDEDLKSYKDRAEAGIVEAQIFLGWFYYIQKGEYENYEESVKWFSMAAEQNSPYAQYQLGFSYDIGRGVNKDYDEAVKWYRKAAEQGNPVAQNNLGFAYAKGKGVAQDYNEAVNWYRKAAEQGYSTAQNNLGMCYLKIKGVEPTNNYLNAFKWFRMAAEQGDAEGQKCLGYCYKNHYGVAMSYAESEKWYAKAAEQGDADAIKELGDRYYNGVRVTGIGITVNKDYEKAVKWYEMGAEIDDIYSLNMLADCYRKGRGVERDLNKAAELYKRAADQGDEYGMAHYKKLKKKLKI